MKNWRTTLVGGLLAAIIAVQPLLETGVIDWSKITLAAIIAILGYVAKDSKVTGV